MKSTGRSNERQDLIWQMTSPVGSGYASLLVIEEEMEKLPTKVLCDRCGASTQPDRLIVEWDDGSDTIGDFTHARGNLISTERAYKELRREFRRLESRPVVMHDHKSLYRPKGRTKRKRVWLPYDGPPLRTLDFPHVVDLRPESTVIIDSTCEKCGRVTYEEFVGIEELQGSKRIPRKRGKGLFVSAAQVGDHDFFGIRDTGLKLCSSRVRAFVEAQGYRNVEFLEVGNILN